VLECVHRAPEPVVFISQQLTSLQQPLKGLMDELFAIPDVIEDLAPEDEEPAIDADWRFGDVLNRRHDSARLARHEVVTDARLDTDEAGDRLLLTKVLQLVRQRQVGE